MGLVDSFFFVSVAVCHDESEWSGPHPAKKKALFIDMIQILTNDPLESHFDMGNSRYFVTLVTVVGGGLGR